MICLKSGRNVLICAVLVFVFFIGVGSIAKADSLSLCDMTINGECSDGIIGPISTPKTDDFITVNSFIWGNNWTFRIKDESDQANPTATFLGVEFTLSAQVNSTSGSWTLNAVDTNANEPINIGDSLDFIGVLKAGPQWVAYYFNDVELKSENLGTFEISFDHANGSTNALSHLTLYIRENLVPDDDELPVPEPSGLILLGSGLLGLAAWKFKKN